MPNIVIDHFQPADAVGVTQCYRAVYGDSFPVSQVYDPGEVLQRNSGNDQYTVVARTESGQVVGLIGMFRAGQSDHVFELGQLMVQKEYRSLNIAERLNDFILEQVPQLAGIHVLYVESLCSHTVSQKMALNSGMQPAGLELEVMPVSVTAGRTQQHTRKRDSLLLMFHLYRDRPQTVFLPDRYAPICTRIYAGLGAERTISDQTGPPAQKTTSFCSAVEEAELQRITITTIGRDLHDHVENILGQFKDGQQYIVHIQLKLDDPAVDYACSILERQGFYISGLLPQWFGADGLLLQKLPGNPDFSSVKLLAGAADEIGGWVEKNFQRLQG